MPNKKKSKPQKYERQRKRTAQNKIKRIKKALLTAGGKLHEQLEERLSFWEKQL